MHILIVDDNVELQEALVQVLEDAGYQVSAACDGAAALNLMNQKIFDLIVLDLSMPGMDGYMFLSAIKGKPEENTPVMVFSVHDEVDMDGYKVVRVVHKLKDEQGILFHIQEVLMSRTLEKN